MAFDDLIVGIVLASAVGVAVIAFSMCFVCRCCLGRYKQSRNSQSRGRTTLTTDQLRTSALRGLITTPNADSSTLHPSSTSTINPRLEISVISSGNSRPSPLAPLSSCADCPQCSYLRPSDVPPPSYYDVVPREQVEEQLKKIFDPPSYSEAQRTSRSLDDLARELEEELPSYSDYVDKGCYVNYALDVDDVDVVCTDDTESRQLEHSRPSSFLETDL